MIKNSIIAGGGVKLPELTNPGAAADLLTGKQLIDADGNVLTGTMPEATQATPSISVNSSGLITASATQAAGKVAAGTKSATRQLTTQAGTTITPGTSQKTAVASGRYTTGNVLVAGDANLVAANIKSGVSIFGVAGSYAGPQVVSDRLYVYPYELGWTGDTQNFSVELTKIPSEILWLDMTIGTMAAIERASYNSSVEYIVSLHGSPPSYNKNFVGLFGITAFGGGSIHLATSFSSCYFLANTGNSKVLTFYGNNKIYHAVNTVYTTITLDVVYKV